MIMKFSRRDLTKMMIGAAALGLVEHSAVAKIFAESKRSMLWLSAQTASGEGSWTNLKIEGKMPKNLNGTLFRTAPGMSENFGTPLNHLFDGDAYLSAWKFENGKVALKTRFLQTPQRLEEQAAKQMLYGEYGTSAPQSNVKKNFGGKNQPSVNVVEWRGKLLGLSEGGLPTVINAGTFDYEGLTDFGGVVPQFLTFTAHPRFDAKTGDMFAYGFEKRPPGSGHIYQIERATGAAKLLYKMPMDGFYMVHDSILTENYFILLIPPVRYDVRSLMSGKTMADATSFLETKPIRLLAFPRDNQGGAAQPIEIKLPAQFFFHFGNAFETADGRLVFDVISSNNAQLLETLRTWKKDPFKAGINSTKTWETLRRVTVDLKNKTLASSEDFAENVEFPRYDARLTGTNARYLYTTENGYGANSSIIRVDMQKNSLKTAAAGKTRTFGEPVFVPNTFAGNEERGWLLTQGYDGDRNESYLEIRDAQTLEFEARVWANGQHFPLGFHGNFYAS